jgi:hypothetical protein
MFEEFDDETEDDGGITWATEEAWSTPRQDYSGINAISAVDGDVKLHLDNQLETSPTNLKRVSCDQLNAKQKVAFMMARRARSPDATMSKNGCSFSVRVEQTKVTLFIQFLRTRKTREKSFCDGNDQKSGDGYWWLHAPFAERWNRHSYVRRGIQQGGLEEIGTQGVVKDFFFPDGVVAPSLPDYVWVDCGDQYKGASFFENNLERKGWVPIYPVTITHTTKAGGTMIRKIVWKAQGQTIRGCLVFKLGPIEKSHGLTYTAFSRATRLLDIGIIGGLTRERIMGKIQNGKGMKIRIDEEKRSDYWQQKRNRS